MNLYKLTLIPEQYKVPTYDYMHGIIVAAENPKEARKIANKLGMEETTFDLEIKERPTPSVWEMVDHNNIWLKPRYTNLKKIGVAEKGIKKGSVLEDVQWG